jgi:hypothetical protein
MRAFILTVLFVFVAGMAFAADIDGNWEGEMQGAPGGEPMKINYTFKADGNTLTGSTKNAMDGSVIAIKDGKIDGNNFSFVLEMMGMSMPHTGTVKGDTIELKPDMSAMGGGGGGTPEMVISLKKVK